MNKLLILSVDALNAKDLDFIKTLPSFSRIIQEGLLVPRVTSVYPTLTYCCHSSIITGMYPAHHGVIHNEKPDPKQSLSQDWYWEKDNLRVPTLFDLAKSAGLTTANVLWPVMASAKDAIDYNIPEIWSNQGKSMTSLFLKHGSLSTLPYVLKHRKKMQGTKQPYLDHFIAGVTKDILRHKNPDLMTVHFTEVDSIRHQYGVFSSQAYNSLARTDRYIGEILDLLEKENRLDHTNIIVLGDHGGNDFEHITCLNSLFYEHGLLTLGKNHTITQWSAYANGGGGSVQIYTDSNPDTYDTVYRLLQELALHRLSPIKAIYTQADVAENHHLSGKFSFVVEANDGFVFRNYITEKTIHSSADFKGAYLADHGYLPTHENLKTLLMGFGPDIKHRVLSTDISLVDEGPYFAHLLGLHFPSTDGNVTKLLT